MGVVDNTNILEKVLKIETLCKLLNIIQTNFRYLYPICSFNRKWKFRKNWRKGKTWTENCIIRKIRTKHCRTLEFEYSIPVNNDDGLKSIPIEFVGGMKHNKHKKR